MHLNSALVRYGLLENYIPVMLFLIERGENGVSQLARDCPTSQRVRRQINLQTTARCPKAPWLTG
jgi:hypothetical protein